MDRSDIVWEESLLTRHNMHVRALGSVMCVVQSMLLHKITTVIVNHCHMQFLNRANLFRVFAVVFYFFFTYTLSFYL